MNEKRNHDRRRCLLGARVIFNERTATLSCTVKNVSNAGARLEFGASPLLPENIELLFDSRAGYQSAKVIWRHQNIVGVVFDPVPSAGLPSDHSVRTLLNAMPVQSRLLH